MHSTLEVYCIAFLITSTVALPAFPTLQGPWNAPTTGTTLPILQGPWNSPETTASSLSGSLLSTIPTSSASSTSLRTTSNSSSSTSRSSSSSRTFSSTKLKTTTLSWSRSHTQPSTSRGKASAASTTTKFSTSSAGSAAVKPSGTGIQSTALPVSRNITNTLTYSLSLVSATSPAASRNSSSSGSESSPPVSSTIVGVQSPSASVTELWPISSARSSHASGSVQLASSAVSGSTSATSNISATSTLSPSLSITNTSALSASPSLDACGVVAQYYNPTPKDWTDHDTDAWLNTWVGNNVGPIAASANGFTGAFATWAVGNPDFSCRDDGSPTDCDFNPCNIPVLNAKGVDVRPAYYVMESLVRIHTYFAGLREAFTVGAIGAALSKDQWAETFYKDKDDKSIIALREILNVMTTIVGIVAALSGIGGIVGTSSSNSGTSVHVHHAGTIAGVSASVYGGVVGAVLPTVGQHQDDTFKKSADLGGILSSIVIGAIESFTSANNLLMHGQNYLGSGDLRDYFRGGAFVNYPGIDKNAVTNQMNAFLIGQAINQLYRQQKIFILGGGACGDNQGIGVGPQANSVCRNGKAWYLYWWQENNRISLTAHQWGWVSPPPGSDQLGKGDYAAVTVQDIINSSLDAYVVAGYNYNNVTANQRAQSAITEQWANPAAQGPSWEGTFTIPVCNISASVNSDYYGKQYILEDYGHESRPMWCGPICDGDVQKTKDFIHASNMDNFQSPRHICDYDTPGRWW